MPASIVAWANPLYACVDRRLGQSPYSQLLLDDPSLVPAHRKLADAIWETGAVPSIQLHHAGRQTTRDDLHGEQPVAPSAVYSSADPTLLCRALETSEIEGIIAQFALAAVWAVEADYAVIELHGAHGYLLHQFVSPATNLRDDDWGDDEERRLCGVDELVDAARGD